MIASLSGSLTVKELDRVVVEVGGVGYLVQVSAQTLAVLPEAGSPVQLLCHTHVREDAIQIFGFAQAPEQTLFELLIGISGIGPRLALTVLSGMPVAELVSCVAAEDHKRLQSVPGIGRKTAERIVLELKDRCAKLLVELGQPLQPAAAAAPSPGKASGEVVEALVNLGYKRAQAERAVERVLAKAEQAPDRERLLRLALASIREG
jgi:holliday junction DNA helicase RuvA